MLVYLLALILSSTSSFASAPASASALAADWSEGFSVPVGGRPNPYELSPLEFEKAKTQGKIHAQIYPVEVTGILPPYQPTKKFIEDKSNNPLKQLVQKIFQGVTMFKSMDDFEKWLGLHPYPKESDTGVYQVPYPNGVRPADRLGFGLIERQGAQGFSFSCAACHSGNLFGKTVLGMTNRFPKANKLFSETKRAAGFIGTGMFQFSTDATFEETELFDDMKTNIKAVGAKEPVVLGLDTSLAQVALSLNRRAPDEFATKDPKFENNPRKDILDKMPADSKPAVWWNLKYKNRWLSDGSVISGNPVFTNLLWNEIGRGADLLKLEIWLNSNSDKIRDLVTAVFSSEAPRFTDFFPLSQIDIPSAQLGEKLFNNTCSQCHGTYEKNWETLETVRVNYPEKTKVVDVGTDPNRYLGMKSLEKLNALGISQRHKTVVQAQKGYVPPPLVGIWARWPYFHNNSAPDLCSVLSAAKDRPTQYYAGEANSVSLDFDSTCNGYPLGMKTPASWKTADFLYDTSREGMKNTGHEFGAVFSAEERFAVIQYLQTL
jgi:mono/diheme cytochrome c family protein